MSRCTIQFILCFSKNCIIFFLFVLSRCLPNKQQGYTAGTFRTVVIANNVTLLTKEVAINITGSDVQVTSFSLIYYDLIEKSFVHIDPDVIVM